MKPLFCALALSLMLAPVRAQDAATAPVAASQTAPKSIVTDDGLTVTPLDVIPDIVTKMMNIEMWRFKISAPDKDREFKATLQLREPDATPKFLGETKGTLPKEAEYIFGFMPAEGDDFFKSENLRTYNEVRVLKNFPAQTMNSSGLATVSPNPLFDLNAPLYSFYSPVTVNKDGSTVLMTFNRDSKPNQTPDAELVLVLALEPKTAATK